ncbi:unnamed protein product [Dicrocoelium dendriticum]|nr:unnamed protein product [Dicrocoelium dendriticum]
MSEYESVVAGALRLRSDQGLKRKKRKHKKSVNHVNTEHEAVVDGEDGQDTVVTHTVNSSQGHLTKAQREWEKKKDKRTLENVLCKAEKSHKQRIIEFNNHLETLTEHFDIQKVSWTK